MVSTEFLPRFSIIDGAISAYDVDKRGVVANGSEYLFGVLSVGVVPFALAALVLCYVVVVNLVLRPMALAVGIGRRSGGGEDPAEEREMGMAAAGRGRGGGGILRALSSRSRRRREARLVLPGERDERDNSCISSRCFVDTTKVLVLFFALTSLVCCLVLVLYGAEMQSLSERGTDSFQETLKNEGARLNVARRAAQYTGEAGAAQRAAVLWEHFVKRVVPVVTKNHSVLDDSYFGAIVLVYFVPAAAALIGFASVGFAFRVCRCSEESSPSPLVPWLFVLCACCFGLALGAPALFSDVCGQASEYLASPRLNTRLNAKFASSVYPCASLGMRTAGSWDATAEELGSALASLGLSSDLRAYAVSKTRQLNQDLRAYRTGLGLSEQQVPPLCEPYSALDPENATALRDAGMGLGVVEAAWLVGTEGGNRHGGRTLEWGATPPISVLFSPDEAAQLPDLKKAVEGGNLPYPSLLWVPNRCSRTRANLLENFSKSSSGGGYAGQASAMVQRGLSFEAMEDAAAMAAEAALASDDVVSRANCGFTREALQGMRNYSHGDRCDRLDFVSTVFWIASGSLALLCCLLALGLEILEEAYDYDLVVARRKRTLAYDLDEDQEVEMAALGADDGSWGGQPRGQERREWPVASAPPLPPTGAVLNLPPRPSSAGSAEPVMGYAISQAPPTPAPWRVPQTPRPQSSPAQYDYVHRVGSDTELRRNNSEQHRLPEPPLKVFDY